MRLEVEKMKNILSSGHGKLFASGVLRQHGRLEPFPPKLQLYILKLELCFLNSNQACQEG